MRLDCVCCNPRFLAASAIALGLVVILGWSFGGLEATPQDQGAPRVFFVEPEEGATVESPVRLVFGAENFTIEPVGEGEVHEGAGHHHVGIDTDCLPAGVIIPEASPWIHFGDASTQIDMQFEPGEHRVCLQIGDGEHRTIEGLNAVVHFTVE